MRPRVVIIEDEPDIVEMVRYNFEKEGFDIEAFGRAREGVESIRSSPPDVVLLDIMLPDDNGFAICRQLRAEERLREIPIIFLTARGEEVDRILGLELGADDYVVKPFSPRELVARARAVLRRQLRPAEKSDAVVIGGFRLDPGTHDVSIDGEPVQLSSLEFKLLRILASHPRQIFSRDRLLTEIWGHDCSITERTVDVHIRRLREKIEREPEQPRFIGTVRGAGYRFLVDPDRE